METKQKTKLQFSCEILYANMEVKKIIEKIKNDILNQKVTKNLTDFENRTLEACEIILLTLKTI